MSDSALESVLRRDRAAVLAALVAVAALAWAYVVRLAATMHLHADPMSGMPGTTMSGMPMSDMLHAGFAPWSASDFAFVFTMWAVMMVGMMLPSAAPMILLYARVGRQAAARGKPFAAAAWFAAGYLLAWTAFALFATAGQWALESALLLNASMASASAVFGALVLIAAGLYQWTPLKETCLSQCQSPFFFIQRQGGFRRDPAGALTLGAKHGLFCIGCCWALMALLFVGGVMNLLWIAALAIFVLVEKVVRVGRWLPRMAGACLVGAGVLLLISST